MRFIDGKAPRTASCRDDFRGASAKTKRRCNTCGVSVWGVIVLLMGLALLFYPYASSYLNQIEQQKTANTVSQTVESAQESDIAAQWDAARRYNERLFAGMTCVVDPFDAERAAASNEEYANALNVLGDGAMGEIVVPKIGVDLPIYHGTQGDSMNHAVGHVVNTSLPVGGESSHAVLAGHTGLVSAVLFDYLDKLEVGDYFVIRVLGRDLAYEVYSKETVLPDDTSSLGIQQGQDLVTLVTCTPYGVNSHRLLVHARRCALPRRMVGLSRNRPWRRRLGSAERAFLIRLAVVASGGHRPCRFSDRACCASGAFCCQAQGRQGLAAR